MLGLFGLAPRIVKVDLGHENQCRQDKNDQSGQNRAIDGAFRDAALIGISQRLGGTEQLLAVAENLGPRLLGHDQSLHAVQDSLNGFLILLETDLKLGQIRARFQIICRRGSQSRASLKKSRQQVLERIGVLGHLERRLRTDFITDQQRTGILGDTLGQHHHLVGGCNLASACTVLKLECRDLFCEIEHLRVLLDNVGHVLPKLDQIVLHIKHLDRVLVGRPPRLGQSLQLRLHAVRRWRHRRPGELAAIG